MRNKYSLFFLLSFTFLMHTKVNADTVYVNVMDTFFDPSDFTVQTGDFVKWTLMQGSHTTTSMTIPPGAVSWNYNFTGLGDSFVYEVTEPGSYNYECMFHPGMTGSFSTASSLPDTVHVNVMDTFFDPADFTAQVGDIIKWTLMEGAHTTTSNSIPSGAAPWDYTFSGIGDSFTYEVTTIGIYEYECLFHLGMTGSFAVIDSTSFLFEISYTSGWNFVSVPGLHPDNQNVNTWWPGRDPSANVFSFNGGYQSVTNIEPGKAYWMKHLTNQTYRYVLLYVPNNPINVNAGWNSFGGYECIVQVSGITTNPPGLIEGSVFGYAAGYQMANEIVPGYGYWVKLSSAAQLILPLCNSFDSKTNTVQAINKNLPDQQAGWGKIIVTDNSGRSSTLYAVNNEINIGEYENPDLPPSGVFDVRFSSGRYVEELSSTKQIEMNGMTFPIRVKVEKINIVLTDETGNLVNEKMRSGTEIIVNQNINKLLISKYVVHHGH